MQYRNTGYTANSFTTFYFEKNLQGDIVALYDANGAKVLSYNYDAWGNHTTTWHNSYGVNMYAIYNPFRYRGYYYDTETGLYYLQSRYYNPQWGRFLNADGLVSTGQGLLGYNMYAYCNNNPIVCIDDTGTDAIYVANQNDLLLVGHAYLYIQDEDEKWYRTEFTGKFPFKSTARVVVTGQIAYDDIKADISSNGVYSVYLKGNYEESLAQARKYAESASTNGYNGQYNLLLNNCLDYTTDVLSYGTNIYQKVDDFISISSIYCVPINYYSRLQLLVLSEELSSKQSKSRSCGGGGASTRLCRVALY